MTQHSAFHTVEYMFEEYSSCVRVRRATWPADTFDRLTRDEFHDLQSALAKPIIASLFPTILVELVD